MSAPLRTSVLRSSAAAPFLRRGGVLRQPPCLRHAANGARSHSLLQSRRDGASVRRGCGPAPGLSRGFLSNAFEASQATDKQDGNGKFAFCFDIDGVLLHSSKPIPGAAETLRYLQKNEVPFVLLTNGGGKPEAERAAELSSILGVDIDASNFVQSHTPFKILAGPKEDWWQLERTGLTSRLGSLLGNTNLNDKNVLVIGSDASKARNIAKGYGFQSVLTPADILHACPAIFPFNTLPEFYDKQEVLPLPKPIYNAKDPGMKLEDCLKIDAVLVFNDPRDWALDLQLIIDLQYSDRGYLGTSNSIYISGYKPGVTNRREDFRPPVIFSNNDLVWSTEYPQTRLAQGAFRLAVMSIWQDLIWQTYTNIHGRIPNFVLGKPNLPAYAYATRTLVNQIHRGAGHDPANKPWLRSVYMVGDNVNSDIKGTRNWREHTQSLTDEGLQQRQMDRSFKAPWNACLVRTGVWDENTKPLSQVGRNMLPDTVHDDVRSTVNWALSQEGWSGRVE